MQPSRGGGSDGKTCRLPHGIRTGPVTSPVVASSRDQPHQRAHGTNAGTVTTTHGPPGRIAGNTPAVPVPSKRVAAQPPKPLTKEHHGGALGDQLLPLLDQGEREVFRTMALLAVADAPSPWQRAACVDYVEHQRHTPTAHDAAIDDEHERLQGQLCQSYLRVRYNRDLFCAPVVAPPPGKALTPTLGLCPVRDVRSHVGQWRTLASYDAADQRGEGRHVPGDRACWLARIPWCEGVPYGTRPAEVVTHRLLLLDWLRSPERVYDGATS